MNKEKQDDEVFLIESCEQWKSNSSKRLVGICKTRKSFNEIVSGMLKDNAIMFTENSKYLKPISEYSIKELQDKLMFVQISIIKLNEKQ